MGNVTNGQIGATVLAGWQTVADEFDNNMIDADGTTWIPILLHGRIPTTGTASYTPITGVRANPIIRNQRRRQIGIGV
jgi:hypothetical protein